ncbi:type II toxin-antitoxin system VapC family toxin [Dyadobacter fermentans]|jgi:tRNA(fMet)-specific endonuclease VapC|uniref:type II toxin-antitoxin system VapC family toxin n=1 Tax=Dyadobacter fermentans TaxID=94254 RepID=UPI001CC0E069|nr:type II toxin-antitoxin system VapC family toxin [Dyadobacter fermentans]MBZ1357260.1 type II toxin-antitoxin system VapC family toxin [Dyadobacter fermentans]
MLLLDTNILIDYLRGKQAAIEFIDCAEKLDLAVNTVIVLELYNGCLNKAELAKIRRLLNGFNHFDLNEATAQAATQIGHSFALSHSVTASDALIAATALVYNLELRTANMKDFRMIPGLKVSNAL